MVADALAATLAAVDLLPSVLALAVLFLHCRAESSKDSTKLNKTSARAPEWLAGVRNTGMAGHSGAPGRQNGRPFRRSRVLKRRNGGPFRRCRQHHGGPRGHAGGARGCTHVAFADADALRLARVDEALHELAGCRARSLDALPLRHCAPPCHSGPRTSVPPQLPVECCANLRSGRTMSSKLICTKFEAE